MRKPYTQAELREMREDIRDGLRVGGGVGSRTDIHGNVTYFRSTGGSITRALRRRYVHPDVARAEYEKKNKP